ncbi:SRPBCC family protein [Planctomicrobium sp.]|jgi:ligand-binding SRPBCC domain-containing protein|nr:SRPBCC family protein [Planctomicrobium sp.]MBT5019828.1 SRPBCC family protein [Planctomicrobium sp.]MDB4733275.1 SRPBCC family protein [Planctomicrobium sp.]
MSIEIREIETGWVFEAQQFFEFPRAELFEFFGDAANLEAITPPWLNFKVITPQPIEMQVGALIDYKLKLHMIPIKWRTEISVWEPPVRFTDSQLKGPYKKWIHEHTFIEQDDGTLMIDRVEYDVPLGRLAHSLAVRKDLEKIFAYRQKVLTHRFSQPHRQTELED